LPSVQLGEQAGEPTHSLIVTEMPAHNHAINGSNAGLANNANPTGNALGIGAVASNSAPVNMYHSAAPGTALNPQSCGIAGGSQPHNNMQPYLGMNYLIALEGIFPSRN
jgi:microcystin-dependent protein